MSNAISCLTLFCLFCALVPSVSALTITSDAPCNIFVAGSPVRLDIKDAQGDFSYEIIDYFGGNVSSGKTSAIELPSLKPGWYEVKCKDAAGEASTTFGVVMNRGNAPLPEDGRVCIDVAAAWLVKKDAYKPVAQMIRMAGIPWMRERLRWGSVEKERGKFDWAQYQTVADAFAAKGIRICQVWHDSPGWTHPGKDDILCPDDLRDVYNYCRTAAGHFSRQIQAWEIWNEEDAVIFWPELTDRYSSLLKAAYWGIKDGNPQAMVLVGSLCSGVSMFAKGIYECGIADYFDVFNWHTYSEPPAYPGLLTAHLDLLKDYGADDRPVWATEVGFGYPATEGPDNQLLNSENQRKQCRFMPRSIAMSLAAGNDKNFYFILPSWGGESQLGALRPDLTPYPSFLSLSAAANIIGLSEYKGEYKTGSNAIVAQVFSTPKGNVLVAWSDTESEMVVPTDKRTVQVANIFGDESILTAENGELKVKAGPDAIYLLDIGKPVEKKLTGKPRPRGKLPKLNPSRVVVAGSADLLTTEHSYVYLLPNGNVFDYNVEVYNFNDKGEAKGTVEVIPPAGWTVEDAKRPITVGAMGRESLTFRVRPGTPTIDRSELAVRAKFEKDRVAPCISGFSFDPARFTPTRRQPLDWAEDAARWEHLISPNGTFSLSNPEPGVLHFDVSFKGNQDRWVYPTLQFEKPMDMSAFDGIACDLSVPVGDLASAIRLMLVEPNGAYYMCLARTSGEKRRVVFLFRDMRWVGVSLPDPNGHLDLNAISAVRLGCNAAHSEPGRIVLDWSGFELVKLGAGLPAPNP